MSGSLPPTPLMAPEKARDIARGHMALAELYHAVGMLDEAIAYNRNARLWLSYSQTLKVVGAEPATE